MVTYKNLNYNDFYTDLDNKLKNLSDDEDDYEYLYIDPDVIILFDEIKYDFYDYNNDAYNKALRAANKILYHRKAIETKLCPGPEVPFLLDNYNRNTKLKSKGKCNKITKNGYSSFIFAEKNYKLCINYLHSFIYSIPTEPSARLKHEEMLDRARLILKRNLDIIRKIYLLNSNLKDPQINDYDTFVPYNKYTNLTGINDSYYEENFNFF